MLLSLVNDSFLNDSSGNYYSHWLLAAWLLTWQRTNPGKLGQWQLSDLHSHRLLKAWSLTAQLPGSVFLDTRIKVGYVNDTFVDVSVLANTVLASALCH